MTANPINTGNISSLSIGMFNISLLETLLLVDSNNVFADIISQESTSLYLGVIIFVI
ncbi:MAG: hypothetical protein PHQ11_13795 [Paludibacter sp.]|nr:hypothetical protein [Paludibacter sp.]